MDVGAGSGQADDEMRRGGEGGQGTAEKVKKVVSGSDQL